MAGAGRGERRIGGRGWVGSGGAAGSLGVRRGGPSGENYHNIVRQQLQSVRSGLFGWVCVWPPSLCNVGILQLYIKKREGCLGRVNCREEAKHSRVREQHQFEDGTTIHASGAAGPTG